ncbi:DUF2510 domain-containing protein [Rhodococcus erythropolis]
MSTPPAGWHPDPEGNQQLRYWDGQQWTSATQPMSSSQTPRPADPHTKKRNRTLLLAALGIVILVVGGVYAYQEITKPSVCKEYCSAVTDLNDQKCTEPTVHNCNAMILEKVSLAQKVNDKTVSEAAMSREVERIHSAAGSVDSVGSRWERSDCSEPQDGDDLYKCRTIAADMDEEFDDLAQLLLKLK